MSMKKEADTKKMANMWAKIISKKKEIILSMEVARILDDERRIKDEQVFRRNGQQGDPHGAYIPIDEIISYQNYSYLPQVWARIIAEFAKPFVPGLTKKIAPQLRDAYIKQYHERRQAKMLIYDRMSRRMKEDGRAGELTHQHLEAGNYGQPDVDFYHFPVMQQGNFYISFLRKKLRNKDFAKRFIKKYVIVGFEGLYSYIGSGRTYNANQVDMEKFHRMIYRRKIGFFMERYSLLALAPRRRLDPKDDFISMLQEKCKGLHKRDLFRSDCMLFKYRNRLYVVIY